MQWFLDSYAAVDASKACLVPQYCAWPEPSEAQTAALRCLSRIAARLAAEGRG